MLEPRRRTPSEHPRLLGKLPALSVSEDDARSTKAFAKHAVLGL